MSRTAVDAPCARLGAAARWPSVARDAAFVAAAGALLAVAAVVGVAVLDVAESLRGWYGLTPQDPVTVGVGELWLHNARVMVPAFAAAVAVAWWPRARVVFDGLLVVVLGVNVLVVAVALGAYGGVLWRLGPAHYPLELLAIAIAVAAYLDARRRGAVSSGVLGGCGLAVAVVLLMAAAIEAAAV